jgi:hypothetical protein
MPRVELYDVINTAYRCDTLDPDLLLVWLSEWAPRLAQPDCALRMNIFPLPLGPSRLDGFDWPADNRFIGTPFVVPDEPGQIIEAMDAERARIEKQIAENPYDGRPRG